MKKLLSLLLAACLCISLAACGGSAPSTSAAPSTAPAANNASSAAQPADEPVTIEFYTWEASLKDQNEAVISAFEQKYPNIKVNINYPVENDNNAYTEKMDMLLLSDTQVDAMMESATSRMTSKVQRGLYQPLDSFFATEGTNYDDIYNVSSQIDGQYYGLPIDVTPWFVLINNDMLEEAGLPVPPLDWTWDDYREYAKVLTEKSSANYGSYFHTWNNYYLMGMYSAKLDNAFYNPDGSLAFENPAFGDWLQFRWDMENVDKSSVPFMEIMASGLAYRDLFFNEEIAMLPTGGWMIAEIKDVETRPHDFKTTFAALPNWKDSPKGRTFSDTKMLSITKNAKHPNEAFEFIRFYTTEGAIIRAGGLTAMKSADVKDTLRVIAGENPDALYDMDALFAVFDNPNFVHNAPLHIPEYNSEINSMFIEESEKFMVGGQSLDDCIKNIMSRGEAIIAKS